jgi:hypothetical protein
MFSLFVVSQIDIYLKFETTRHFSTRLSDKRDAYHRITACSYYIIMALAERVLPNPLEHRSLTDFSEVRVAQFCVLCVVFCVLCVVFCVLCVVFCRSSCVLSLLVIVISVRLQIHLISSNFSYIWIFQLLSSHLTRIPKNRECATHKTHNCATRTSLKSVRERCSRGVSRTRSTRAHYCKTEVVPFVRESGRKMPNGFKFEVNVNLWNNE